MQALVPRHPAPFPAVVSWLDEANPDTGTRQTALPVAIPSGGVSLVLHVPNADRDRPRTEPILSISEQSRLAQVQHPRALAEFVAGRFMIRTTLGHLLGIEPADVIITESARGALSLDSTHHQTDLCFNLSHTDGLVVLAVARQPVGVDVEWLDRTGRTVELADRYFARTETGSLLALAGTAQRDRFFDLWTLKEAYIKARGLGLALSLGGFAFDRFESPPLSVAVDAALADRPDSEWSFGTWDRPDTRHRIAVALASG